MSLIEIGKLIGMEGKRLSVDEEISKRPEILSSPIVKPGKEPKPRLLTTAEIMKHYGQPGDPDNMTIITTPYPLRIAWDKSKTTDRLTVNEKVAPRLLKVMNQLHSEYGLLKLRELGIDLYGGLYNFRPQRGLEKKYAAAIKAGKTELAYTYLSRHSWATAIDLDPERNQLKETSKTARFARPEYNAMIDIFYNYGFIGYGIERNNDFMHFEIGVLL